VKRISPSDSDASPFTFHASRFVFEALEPRLLLSAGPAPELSVISHQLSDPGGPSLSTQHSVLSTASPAPGETTALQPSLHAGIASGLFSIDIDHNHVADADTDGKLLLRYLAGLPDLQLESAMGVGALRDTAQEIRSYLEPFRTALPLPLDADGNGFLDVFTDGRLFYRFLAGVPDVEFMRGAVVGAGATRTTAAAITSFLTPFHPERELTPPDLNTRVFSDTGVSATDGVTMTPSVAGTVQDINAITLFRARLDLLPLSTLLPTVEILSPGNSGLVALGTLPVQFQVRNHVIGGEGEAHLHIYVDADPAPYHFYNGVTQEVWYQGEHTHFMHWRALDAVELHGLTAGSHQLRVVLADAADQELAGVEASDTVAFSVATPPSGEFQLQSMVSGLGFPVAMAFAPDGRLFYNELATGRMRVVSASWQVQSTPVHTFSIATSFEQGLLGIAVDPDFAVNHDLYVFHSVPGSPVRNQVVRITETNGVGSNPTVIIPNLPAGDYHNGGNLHFGPDGKLYITIGDNGGSSNAQNPSSLAGKILRYNKDGTIPSDNPTPGSPVYALGLRNSFDFTFHSETGDLWATENGVLTDDEVNRIIAGGNYGWPNKTGLGNNDPQYIDPIIEFTPTIAPTGIVSISDQSAYPEPYHQSLLFADYNSGRIHRLALSGSGLTALAGHSVIYSGGQGGLLDLVEGPDGYVYASSASSIFRLTPSTTDPFQLTNVTATGITETAATISWSTSVPADTQVEYGLAADYGMASPLAPALVSQHTVTLAGLTPGETYHYRVASRDQFGRPVFSADQTFHTPQFAVLPNSVDVLSDLAQSGTFLLTKARLAELFGALADGPYALRFQAKDARDNVTFSDLFFTLDTTASGEPLVDLMTASDSGLSDADDVTNDATPTVRLTSESGRLRIVLNGIPVLQADTSGTFDFSPTSPLADGVYEITATVEDTAGNVSLLSSPLSITIDTAPPAPPTWDLAPSSDTEVVGDQKTTAALVTLEGQAEPRAPSSIEPSH
jgi:glucose/arabinose dehydrogenase